MPKQTFKRISVPHHKIQKIPYYKRIPERITRNLFNINRKSVSKAFLFGVFFALIPMPFQMMAVLLSSITFKHNLPISIGLVWLTNPLTMPFIFGLQYLLGCWLFGYTIVDFSFNDLSQYGTNVLAPLYLGSLVSALSLSLLSYLIINRYWILKVQKKRSK